MKVEVYWDSLFLMNMLINWWVLELLKNKFALSANGVRMGSSAFIGGGIYVVILMYCGKNALCQLPATLCSVVLMGIIILGKRKRKLLFFFLCSFAMYHIPILTHTNTPIRIPPTEILFLQIL